MATELFANQPQTTVLTGGTDSPVAGTIEVWQVLSSTAFPAASDTAFPATQFHIADTATGFSSEIMAVTNVSGNNWTVVRGAEGTTPIAHTFEFTVTQVLTAGALTSFNQFAATYAPIPTSGDTSGDTDSATIAAALTTYGVAVLQPGSYYLGGIGLSLTQSQSIVAPGAALTTIFYAGTGIALTLTESGGFSSSKFAGTLQGFSLNGYGAGSSSVGIQYGNLQALHAYDVSVSGFGGIGWHFLNAGTNWAEENTIQSRVIQCGTANTAGTGAVIFDTGSFDYSNYDFTIVTNPATNGVLLQNAALLQGVNFRMRGNFYANTGSNTAVVIGVDVGNTSGTSYFKACQFDVSVEADGTGVGHSTVWMGSTSSTSQFQGQGVLSFNTVGGQTFQGYHNASNVPFGFSGIINDAVLGTMAAGDGLAVQGGSQWGAYGNATKAITSNIFFQFGDVQMLQLSSGSNTVAFNGVSSWAKRVDLFLVQPSSSSAGTVVWPGSVVWAQGQAAPYLQTANNAVDRVRLTYHPATSTWYGEYLAGSNNLPTFTNKSTGYIQGQANVSTSNGATNGQLRLSPLEVSQPMSVSAIGTEFTAQGDPTSVVRLAIYNDDGSGYPFQLVVDAGSISTGTSNSGSVATGGTANVYTITIASPPLLTPGIYWLGGAVQGVTTTVPTMRVGTFGNQFSGANQSQPSAGGSNFGYLMTGVTGACPGTFTTWASASASGTFPRVVLKIK